MNLASPEFIALLIQFGYGISSGVITNLWLKSYCLLLPNITEANCSGELAEEIENKVQPQVATAILYKTIIETLLPGLSILFVGPWSDSHGRRPILLLSIFGFFLSYIIWAVLSLQVESLNPLYFLMAAIPVGLTGGMTTFFLAIICVISDITTVQNRAFKMAGFEAACMVGVFASQILTAKVSAGPNGFLTTFSISAATFLVLLLYIYFFIPETVIHTQEIKPERFILDVFKSCFKNRPNHGRTTLLLLLLANTAYIFIIFGESSIFYLNTKKRFGWKLGDFAQFASCGVILTGLELYLGTWLLSNFLRLNDITVLFSVSILRIFTSSIFTFSKNWRFLYLGMGIGCLSALITPLYRAQVSKIVPLQELGKVISFLMFLESMVPLSASFLYTLVYKKTIEVFPAGVFLVSLILSVICTVCFLLAYIIQRLYPGQDFSRLQEINTDENSEAQAVNKNNEE